MLRYTFFCIFCNKTITSKKDSKYIQMNHKLGKKVEVGVLVKSHYRHAHSDYMQQVKLSYQYYLGKGYSQTIAYVQAKSDAREKFERDYVELLKNNNNFQVVKA